MEMLREKHLNLSLSNVQYDIQQNIFLGEKLICQSGKWRNWGKVETKNIDFFLKVSYKKNFILDLSNMTSFLGKKLICQSGKWSSDRCGRTKKTEHVEEIYFSYKYISLYLEIIDRNYGNQIICSEKSQ